MEEVFANQLVTMVKGLPFGDIFQEVSGSSQPGSVMHQENSQRALKVCLMRAHLTDRPSASSLGLAACLVAGKLVETGLQHCGKVD